VEVSGGCNGRGATKPTTTRSGDVGRATADHYVVDGTQYVRHCAKHCVAVMLKCHLYAGKPPAFASSWIEAVTSKAASPLADGAARRARRYMSNALTDLTLFCKQY
jgi:hypothetical protein